MIPEDMLAELERLCAEATAGPWVIDPVYPGRVYSDDATGSIVGSFTDFRYAPRRDAEILANAALTAAARDALPALVAEVRTLRAERDALQKSHDTAAEMCAALTAEGRRLQDKADAAFPAGFRAGRDAAARRARSFEHGSGRTIAESIEGLEPPS